MKYTLPILFTIAITAPAWAHQGTHVHPHTESGVPVLAGLAAIALAGVMAWRSR